MHRDHRVGMSEAAAATVPEPAEGPDFLALDGEVAAQLRAYDWAATGLGDPRSWPQSLKTTVRIMLTSRYAMWMAWGPQLTFFCNDAYLPTVGLKRDWVLGARSDKVWEEIWPDIGPRIERVLRTGRATWDEGLLLFLERSGYPEETYHTFSYSPLADDGGAVTGMLCVVTEETERVVGERRVVALRELAASLAATRAEEAVLDAVRVAVLASAKDIPFALLYLFDEAGRLRLRRAAGIAGDHPAAPAALEAGGPWPDWLAEARTPALIGDLAGRFGAALPTGAWARPPSAAVVLPVAWPGQDKPAGCLLAGLNPHRDYAAAYAGFLDLFVGQVSAGLANARAHEEERRRAEALAELDRAKTLFFSNVSHEFRTPLTLMMSPLEEALASPDSEVAPGARALLDLAQRNSMRLLKLVNTLLDFTRIEAGRAQASFEPLDLAAVTAELASNFRSATERAGLLLSVDCPPLPQPVHADRDMWEKIVLNLLSNAFKFTFEGGIEVGMRPSPDGRAAVLTVADTGVGVPPDELPRLFERFHRIEGQASRSFEGSGIGLALVQELVKLHGGAIAVESAVGKGMRFAVTLPFGTAHLPRGRIGAARPHQAATSLRADAYVEEAMRWLPEGDPPAGHELDPAAPFGAAEDARVLVADDNADMRDYIRRLLRGWQVEVVADGRAALDAIRARKPDIVLTDIMMPRLDGFGLLRAIRADPGLRDLAVILLSARAGEEARVEGLEAGADDYLTKPFSARELVARLRANLALVRVRGEMTAALRDSEQRLRAVYDLALDGLFVFKAMRGEDGRIADFVYESVNPAAARLLATEAEAMVGRSLLALWPNHAGEGGLFQRYCRVVETGEPHDFELLYEGEGFRGWFRNVAVKLGDGLMVQVADVTARHLAEEQRTLLINELNHRVKNTLATVQSIAAQTLRGANVEPAVREALEARLFTLASAHDMLTQQNWEGAHLGDVVVRALAPFRAQESRFDVEGPDVRLSPKSALAISMALHELATNAVKYGALSGAAGRVAVRWATEGPAGAKELLLEWEESGGPAVQPPGRRGFGSRLIERGLAGELGGEARIDYAVAGLRCRIRAPLPHDDAPALRIGRKVDAADTAA